MRIVIKPSLCVHHSSAKCEICLPKIAEGHKTGYCVMEEVEDGKELTTLVVLDEAGNETEIVVINGPEDIETFLSDRELVLAQG